MSLFNFFHRNNNVSMESKMNHNTPAPTTYEPKNNDFENRPFKSNTIEGIEQVYNFLQADFELKGYNDSLVNPDDSYKADNIKLIKFDLQILIEKTSTYYENLISEINFHITTRSRAGLIDLVKELENRKSLIEDFKVKLTDIKASMNDENGMCQRIILSYQRGFMKGLSAQTHSNVLNKKL